MEASGTPPQDASPPPPPPPPPPTGVAGEDEKAGGLWRALGIVLALALAFACAVMIAVMIDIGGTPTCDDPEGVAQALAEEGLGAECFDGSSAQKTISLVLGWPSGILAGIAALMALAFTITGRNGRLLLQLTGAAVVLGALSILVGSI